jgi:hypothetical protein
MDLLLYVVSPRYTCSMKSHYIQAFSHMGHNSLPMSKVAIVKLIG